MGCSLESGGAAELAVSYAARTLEPRELAEFERHLDSCPSCRTLVAQQEAVWAALDEFRPAPISADFDQKVFQRIGHDGREGWSQTLIRAPWSWGPAVPVAAACAVLLAAFLLKTPEPAAAPPSSSAAMPQIEQQVLHALDDMDMLTELGVDAAVENSDGREKI